MAPSDVRAPSSPSLDLAVLDLIDLLQAATEPGTAEVLALRRALHGQHRPADEAALTGRFQRARVCVVALPTSQVVAVRSELAGAAGVLTDSWDCGLVVLVPGLPRDARRDPVAGAVTRIQRAAPSAAMGVSTELDHVGQAARGLDEARRALDLCEAGRVVHADDEWFAIAASRLRDSLRDSLVVGGPLARLDDCALDLRTTLATWLELDGDVRATAERLHLHPNTLRYRLRRAGEVTGIDLSDPVQRLVVHLALTQNRVIGPL